MLLAAVVLLVVSCGAAGECAVVYAVLDGLVEIS